MFLEQLIDCAFQKNEGWQYVLCVYPAMTKFFISPKRLNHFPALQTGSGVSSPYITFSICKGDLKLGTHCSGRDSQHHIHHHHNYFEQQKSVNNEDKEIVIGRKLDENEENKKEEAVGLNKVLMQGFITGTPDPNYWCYRGILTSVAVVAAILVILIFGHSSLCVSLLWLEHSDPTVSVSVLAALFVVVCFPVAWGLTLLMVAAGYLYGVLYGPIVVTGSVSVGLVISTAIMRTLFSGYLRSFFRSCNVEFIVDVVGGPHGMRVVALARLTPIPFGLQNALFSLSSISLWRYLISSTGGLIPMTVLNCYMGSTLRHMQDLISTDSSSLAGFLIFGGQILVTAVLLWFMVRKAREELKKAMDETSISPTATTFPSSNNCSENALLVDL